MLVFMVVCCLLNTACNSAGAQGCWSFQIGGGGSSLEGTLAAYKLFSANSVVEFLSNILDAPTCISFAAPLLSKPSLARFSIPNFDLASSFVTM